MVKKSYAWSEGAVLLPHTAKKLDVLREYFSEYLRVRCPRPQQSHFRLAVVDGFCGGGKYAAGESGSPLVFIEVLQEVTAELNVKRQAGGLKSLAISCDLILNDANPDTAELAKNHVNAAINGLTLPNDLLSIRPTFISAEFERAYPDIKALLRTKHHQNVLFNLDPCGNSSVERRTISDIMSSFRSAEVFFTAMIGSLINFLNKDDRIALENSLRIYDISPQAIDQLDNQLVSRREWLGAAERIVFQAFQSTASFVSPFSIQNPEGWRYWLMHFSNSVRARQVYNDILHQNASAQAHFGKSGLNMLSYNPKEEGGLYLFDVSGREKAFEALVYDIPRYVAEHGDVLRVEDFFLGVYNATPAHSKDINRAIFENPDLEVLTSNGGERRKAHTISGDDVLRLKRQMSFPSLWRKP
ncbi:MAG: three-Cys-motif partner protein TcmP [Aestuariivirga sp.]|uniref:three-Cys-motif partner protein TcmP n=1 Tax=Aestuariivirga sp. TaxID=2650926 RepID=UPI0025C3C97F|nr:three-Cys-motif partner protein TcmP [Aestuariivirga sp.]MCA3559952.1 three-Cys-motif partner protein TcmP [Aestuariivirga sp.]